MINQCYAINSKVNYLLERVFVLALEGSKFEFEVFFFVFLKENKEKNKKFSKSQFHMPPAEFCVVTSFLPLDFRMINKSINIEVVKKEIGFNNNFLFGNYYHLRRSFKHGPLCD